MDLRRVLAGGILLLSPAMVLMFAPERAVSGLPGTRQAQGGEDVPAFHRDVPKAPLPATMEPALFADALVQNAYAAAARIKKILYQQPCYCHCDRSQGHGSLLDCFASKHGSECGTCMAEDFYAYEQYGKGKTAAQIREGIERGEWQKVDLSKYQHPVAAK